MKIIQFSAAVLILTAILFSACTPSSMPMPVSSPPIPPVALTPLPREGAFYSGQYRNLFSEYLGKSDAEVNAKLDAAWNQLFYGDDSSERVYYPVGSDMAYILDTGNDDVRSEGMSYGMMIAVQLNKKEEFDRIWKWAKTYMYQTDGGYKGYFAWHCKPDGTQLAANPASDGEEWFIMALLFADGRWGSGEGIYNYRAEAQSILDVALHADELSGDLATNLFDSETKQVVFVPQLGNNSQFTDPSYHLPHFYQLWSLWADKDNEFWVEAAKVSREYLKKTVHQQTGLSPNYSYFDGKPYDDEYNGNFRYDAFRVGANIGVDYAWFRPDEWHVEQSNRMLKFFELEGLDEYKAEYLLTGEPEVMHRSPGLIATNAVAALAADPEIGKPFVQALWDQDIPTGKYRYYDGLLMMLALLQVSGNFRIYVPGEATAGLTFPTPEPEVGGKFAPPAGHALLLVGLGKQNVDAYFDATVSSPGGVAANTDLNLAGIDDLDYLAGKYPNSTLSVGVDLKGTLDSVADGRSDTKIDALLDKLASYDRPVFLRLGYGFDDPAKKYTPEKFVSAWPIFHERIQAKGVSNVTLVWEPASSCGESDISDWYPGDEFVDWIGMQYGECSDKLIQFSRDHLKPVMVTAALSSSANWNEWFTSFLQFMKDNNDVVRGLTYLNGGNNRIDLNAEVLKQWKDETKLPFWLKATPNLFHELGYEK
jgi:oligosaccharide reducing-end xylanase